MKCVYFHFLAIMKRKGYTIEKFALAGKKVVYFSCGWWGMLKNPMSCANIAEKSAALSGFSR